MLSVLWVMSWGLELFKNWKLEIFIYMKYFIALVAVVVGILLVIKTDWFISNFGTSSWAEQHMGTSGGTRLLYKLIGIAIIVLAVLGATGALGEIVLGVFGPLFRF